MAGIKFVPTDEAWNYFMKHHDDIRSVVDGFLPVPRMEVPNTRIHPDSEQRDSIPLKVQYSLADFDQAVKDKDTVKLTRIMNDAWLRAPEDRGVYRIPGFSPMCDLLDCTVDGFFPESGDAEDEPE